MFKNVMLAKLIKTRRLEQKLGTMEVSVRTRLDPSLISRYENGNRIPTREHVLRLAEALAIDKEMLLIAWLAEKLKKVLQEEQSALIQEKALALATGQENELALIPGNRITESQEAALVKWKPEIQRLSARFPDRWQLYRETNLITLGRDLNELLGNIWKVEDVQAFVTLGKTISGHDFESHLRMHHIFNLLKSVDNSTGPLSEVQFTEYLNTLEATGLTTISFPDSPPATLMALAHAWHSSLNTTGLKDVHRWLAMVLMLKSRGYPLFGLPQNLLAFPTENGIQGLAEFFGEWLVKEMRRGIDFLEG